MLHNMAEVHSALHQPQCHGHWRGHQGVAADEAQFAEQLEPDELPWRLCLEYARALKSQLAKMTPRPFSTDWDERTFIVSAIRAASRGFQAPSRASQAYEMVANLLRGMDQGRERSHLKSLFSGFSGNNSLIGFTQAEDGSRSIGGIGRFSSPFLGLITLTFTSLNFGPLRRSSAEEPATGSFWVAVFFM
eukprot:s5655_g3.t2